MTTGARRRVLARHEEIARIIARLAQQMLEPQDAQSGLVLFGIRRGGEALATRIAAEIERISGRAPALGFLNINLYRDDRVTHELPESQIPVDVSGKVVVIVDDVLYTGAPFGPPWTPSPISGARPSFVSASWSIAACASFRFRRITWDASAQPRRMSGWRSSYRPKPRPPTR